jgi:hypothetical protein
MNYHYLDPNNQPCGPVALEDIQALARTGKIAPDPMIAPVGGTEWVALSIVTGGTVAAPAGALGARHAAQGAPARPPLSVTALGDAFGAVVVRMKAVLSEAFVVAVLQGARKAGHGAILAGAVLTAGYSVWAAIRYGSMPILLFGVGFVAALVVGQYVASRFLDAGEALIANTPSRFASTAFVECAGLLGVLLGVIMVVLGTVGMFNGAPVSYLVETLAIALMLIALGAVAFHPSLVGIEAGKGTAGEEAIGLLAFALKAALKLVPLAFGLVAVCGLLASFVFVFEPNPQLELGFKRLLDPLPLTPIGSPQLYGSLAIFQACLIPWLAYVAFLVACLPLEIWRALLSLPAKLESLRR